MLWRVDRHDRTRAWKGHALGKNRLTMIEHNDILTPHLTSTLRDEKMKIILTITILLLTAVAFCDERETIRDATGKVVGTATTSGNKTIYRDATGKTTGTATKDGNRTIYRDATGKTVGTATESGSGTTYRDATGKTVGTKK